MIRWRLLLLLLLLLLAAAAVRAYDFSGYLQYFNVEHPVKAAREMLAKNNITDADTADRLAVMLLYSHGIEDAHYGPCMFICFDLLQKNLLPYTKTDIFLFVKPQHYHGVAARTWVATMPNLYIMLLDDSDEASWKMPAFVRARDKGWSPGFGDEYRLMGHWRLGFSFPFAKKLGYKYLLQMDTDTYIRKPVNASLVKFMQEKQLFMTNRGGSQHVPGASGKGAFSREMRDYHIGLAELARYWLLTRRVTQAYEPTITAENAGQKGIKGTIVKHCTPQNLYGLRTNDKSDSNQEGSLGWDAQIIAGHFNIFSLDWWFSWDVQDFVQLVLRSGAHIEHRWVDVSTQTMIYHLFVPEGKFHNHEELSVEHGRWGEWIRCGSNWLSDTNFSIPSPFVCWPYR